MLLENNIILEVRQEQEHILFSTFVCVSKLDLKLKYVPAFVLLPKLYYSLTMYFFFMILSTIVIRFRSQF